MIMRHRFIPATIFTIALLGLLVPFAARASDGPEWVGTITSRPDGTVGDWLIGGRTFSGTAATRTQTEHGPLTVGACADVKYYISGTTNILTEIDSQAPYKCGTTGTGTGTGSGDGSGTGTGTGSSSRLDSYALVEQFPAGLVGSWVIGGVNYTSTATTRSDQQNGVFAVGACVETKFSTLNGVNTILEIETAASYKCTGVTSGVPTVSSGQSYGVLGAFPAGLIGTWTIGGVNYTATATTRIERQRTEFFTGACVDVKYTPGTTTALEISSTDAYRCTTTTTTQPQTAASKIYGLVEVVPATNTGIWTIGGGQYSAASATFTTDHGTLDIGTCATVEFTTSSGVNAASRISTEELTKCNTSTYRNTVYGQITTIPQGLYGTWTINGLSIDSTQATRFEQSEGSLALNGCAEATYYVQNGVNYADKIQSHVGTNCSSSSSTPVLPTIATTTSKIYAPIGSLPATLNSGVWSIGGIDYTATAATQFEQESAIFAVGVCVEARYATQNGVNTLLNVEAKPTTRCQASSGGTQVPVLRAYGAIETLPNLAGTGTWRISGVDYTATASTQLKQEQGFFATGAYVQVTYQVSGTVLNALAIETHVAPGDGRNASVGSLDTRPTDDTGTWVVNGVTYQGDSAMNVSLPAATTSKVLITSYRGLNGVQYITSIAAVQQVYLPSVMR